MTDACDKTRHCCTTGTHRSRALRSSLHSSPIVPSRLLGETSSPIQRHTSSLADRLAGSPTIISRHSEPNRGESHVSALASRCRALMSYSYMPVTHNQSTTSLILPFGCTYLGSSTRTVTLTSRLHVQVAWTVHIALPRSDLPPPDVLLSTWPIVNICERPADLNRRKDERKPSEAQGRKHRGPARAQERV